MSKPLELNAVPLVWRSDYQIGLDDSKAELQPRITELETQLADAKQAAKRESDSLAELPDELLPAEAKVKLGEWIDSEQLTSS